MSQYSGATLDQSRREWRARACEAFRGQIPILFLIVFASPLVYQAMIAASMTHLALADAPLITFWLALPYLSQVLLMVPFVLLLSVPLVVAMAGPMPE